MQSEVLSGFSGTDGAELSMKNTSYCVEHLISSAQARLHKSNYSWKLFFLPKLSYDVFKNRIL